MAAALTMHTEFRRARIPDELRALQAFDRKTFPAADVFPASYWRELESYWMLVDGVRVGCCAFERHIEFRGDDTRPCQGCLYISTTGILPKFQGRGFGRLLKAWQVAFAWSQGFDRIVTNTRKRNRAMIDLNRAFGFRVLRTLAGYYEDPPDATVVMELRRVRS